MTRTAVATTTELLETPEEKAWRLASEHSGLASETMHRLSRETNLPDKLKRESCEHFLAASSEALYQAALRYREDHKSGARFSTFATKILESRWHDVVRQVVAQRGEAPQRGLRPGERGPDGQPKVRLRGSTAYGSSPPEGATALYDSSGTKIEEQDAQILRMIRTAFDLGPHETPELSSREAEAVGYFLWGSCLDSSRANWELDEFHMMLTLLLAEGQYPTYPEIADRMSPSTWGGKSHPVSRQNARTYLMSAAKKLGLSHPESLREKAIRGLASWHIRILLLKRQGRYQPKTGDVWASAVEETTDEGLARTVGGWQLEMKRAAIQAEPERLSKRVETR